MGESSARLSSIFLAILFLISSQLYSTTIILPDYEKHTLVNDEAITSTEIRIHNLGGDWNDSETLEWSPNHLDYNRTIQFSILISGITNSNNIQSLTLNMTWIHDTSSDNRLLSEDLNKSNFTVLQDGLFMTYNYTYPLDIYHDEYLISLDILDHEGELHIFEHQGINVIAYDIYLSPISFNFGEKILFADNQLTILELLIHNTGSAYTQIEFEINFHAQLPSNWDLPNIIITDPNLKGGESCFVDIDIQAPDDVFDSKITPIITLQLIAKYEDFSGQMVEFFDSNYSLLSEVVPNDSIPIISAYRTDFGTDLIINNSQPVDSDINVLEYSLVSLNNESVEFFLSIENYGYNETSFDLNIFSMHSMDFFEINVYVPGEYEKAINLTENKELFKKIAPLGLIQLHCIVDIFPQDLELKDSIIIQVKNLDVEIDGELEIKLSVITLEHAIVLIDEFGPLELPMLNSTILQNDSFNLQITFVNSYLFSASFFQNNWELNISIIDFNGEFNFQHFILNLSKNNNSISIPNRFTIIDDLFFGLIIGVGENTSIGPYSIHFDLMQISENNNSAIHFEHEIAFEVQENTSLLTNIEQNNNSNHNNSTNSTGNNSANNSTNSSNQNVTANLTTTTNESTSNDSNNQDLNSDDSNKAKNEKSNSWIFITLALISVSVIIIIIARRKIKFAPRNIENINNKEVVEIQAPLEYLAPVTTSIPAQITVLRQWTDSNGYTWRQMSDRSMLWWNGHDWVPVNPNS